MAPANASGSVGRSGNNDCPETTPLKLGVEHFPFPCSLLDLVLDRYDDSPVPDNRAHTMTFEELVTYLRSMDDLSKPPWQAILAQTEAIGDPAIPSAQDTAILRWVGHALASWEEQFPLEDPLSGQMRRLKPLIASIAVLDPTFLNAGLHPLHQLLDSIQSRAIGWQSKLDRVGTMLLLQITNAIDSASAWLDDNSVDLAAVCAEFAAAAQRDQSRADRMVQRVVETEIGKVKTAAAKQEAARMINAALEKYHAPEEIGEFLKGPWYSSAQLLLLKFSKDSEQWQKMSQTTEILLDSMQNLEEVGEERQQYIFDIVTRLPKEMRRWLLSLHHDTEAVNEAMGMVEFAHLRILRRQTLEMKKIDAIPIAQDSSTTQERKDLITLGHWQEGQWFSIDNREKGVIRCQLVLKADEEQQLLFTNLAGIKVLKLNYVEFTQLATQNKVTPLFRGVSFSLCLANAAGIKSAEMLEALIHTQPESVTAEPTAAAAPRSQPTPEPDLPEKTAQEVETITEQAEPVVSQALPEEPADQQHAEVDELEIEAEAELNDALEQLLEDSLQEESPQPRETSQQAPNEAAPTVSKGYIVEEGEKLRIRGGYVVPKARSEPLEGDGISANPVMVTYSLKLQTSLLRKCQSLPSLRSNRRPRKQKTMPPRTLQRSK
jgi:hypothetical protein